MFFLIHRFLLAVAEKNMRFIAAKAATGKRKNNNGTVVNAMVNALLGRFDLAPTSVLEYKGIATSFKRDPTTIITSDFQCNLNQVASTVLLVFSRAHTEYFKTLAHR